MSGECRVCGGVGVLEAAATLDGPTRFTPCGHCPKCGAQVLTNGRYVWCSNVGGYGDGPGCSYGLQEGVTVEQHEEEYR